jgi:hypothetical protein
LYSKFNNNKIIIKVSSRNTEGIYLERQIKLRQSQALMKRFDIIYKAARKAEDEITLSVKLVNLLAVPVDIALGLAT